jgi:hypothetical protein
LELFNDLLTAIWDWRVLSFTFAGTFVGILAAAIPGFTIVMAVVLVFPFTFAMTPLEGLSSLWECMSVDIQVDRLPVFCLVYQAPHLRFVQYSMATPWHNKAGRVKHWDSEFFPLLLGD